MNADRFNLQRFVDAQNDVYEEVLVELAHGRKTTHWMWFVFPQLRALGRSVTAHYYGIASAEEAVTYLRHPLLGARLRQCVDLLLTLNMSNPHGIFGSPDDLKLRSCLTLFDAVAPDESRFKEALDRFYPDGPDGETLGLLTE
ncbi:calpastatin [Oxalicibacterium solurbis]|uniref:Calpastatin n=2 Tax=Oxalicibacterium solurbis TaxID=69280 RepID=A0A8J3B4R5_9BURK|nr:calpastatin [Oxalicibacterium solurbis]